MLNSRKKNFLTIALLATFSVFSSLLSAEEFEAESATLSGVTSKTHSAASGGYRVSNFDEEGDSILFNSVANGQFLVITYSLGLPTDKQCSLYVNGLDTATATFSPTGSWNTYNATIQMLNITGSIDLRLDADDQAFNANESCASIDKIAILNLPPPPTPVWRSTLYPEDWTPGFADSQGRFLHDFSYAGYHNGEALIPDNPPGATLDVTQPPYSADNTGAADATDAIQAALDNVGAAGGGIVYLPAGTYRVKPPSGEKHALRIWDSGVVLRGAGPDATYLFNDDPLMRGKSVILARPASGSWHSALSGTTVLLTADITSPTHTLPVADTSIYATGDWVILRTDCTDDFIADHDMTGLWNSGLKGITFYRRLTGVDPASKTLTIDAPTRYYLKTRDNARVYKIEPHLQEVGVENLSIGMRENLSSGWGDNDYSIEGTGAYEVHGSHALNFYHVSNSWIRNVHTYRPPVNTGNYHTLSNIMLLSMTRGVTIRDCVVERPQYEGGGGNGYGYTLRGNDCLIESSVANHTRHNYDFKSMWTSGNAIHNCVGSNSRLASDFHMHMSPANLFDSMTMDGDFLEAKYRPYGTTLHGHPTTESVFWNSYGMGSESKLVVSRQWKWGYVIGTSGPVDKVELGTADNTSPEDFLEGEGEGATLEPQSLYLDQLRRRLLPAPVFSAIICEPQRAAAATTVTIRFASSDPLITHPVVTVNDRPGAFLEFTAGEYAYLFTPDIADSEGPATIKISGSDLGGNAASITNDSALTLDLGPPPPPSKIQNNWMLYE